MKGFYYRVLTHFVPIILIISQISGSDTYLSSFQNIESSIGREFISILKYEKENTKDEVVTKTDDVSSDMEESSNDKDAEESNWSDEVVSYAPQNSISIDSIYYNSLMKDDGSYFYLDHNIYGDYDGIGVPFIDSRMDFYTRKTILYGHSSLSGNGTFQLLQNYMDSSFYWNHPIITVRYNGEEFRYQIFSVYVSLADDYTSDGLEYFYRTSYSDSKWDETIHQYKNNSIYDTGVEVSSSDRILILQTCSMDERYYEKYYRYNLLVMGKLI